MAILKHNKLIRLIFFGNYFYGLCSVALSIEANLQQRYPLNSLLFYLMSFSATVLYYSKAYIMTEVSHDHANLRSMWYARNHKAMQRTQIFFMIFLGLCTLYFLSQRFENILHLKLNEWFLIFLFPLVSAFYYGVDNKYVGHHNLRNIGWLKPFIIGFTWAGLVNIYPVLFYCIDTGTHYAPDLVSLFLFIKNFMYITILCILFDIKDYAMDYNQDLKTVVVKLGLRKTIFYFIIPLVIIGLTSFLIYAMHNHFSAGKMIINTIPFLLALIVAYSMYNRRSIFYYLIVIDGLMLVKALCGSLAMTYF